MAGTRRFANLSGKTMQKQGFRPVQVRHPVCSRKALAAALSLLVSFAIVEGSVAQTIIIDPRSVPQGSPLNNGNNGNNNNNSNSNSNGNGSNSGNSSQSDQVSGNTVGGTFQPGSISTNSSSSDEDDDQDQDTDKNSDRTLDSDTRRDKKPALPNEFEKFVRQATGRVVKRFGNDLLTPTPVDFNVPGTTAIPGDYPISVGDVISVNTIGSADGSADFTVNRNGEIFMPNVGSVKLVGVRYRDLKDRIAAAIGTRYRGFEVSVAMKRLHGIRVYVTGFANQPGAFTVSSLSTLVNAVFAAGGPSSGGSLRDIKLYRSGREVTDFDLYDLVRGGDSHKDAILQNEDVIFIPPVGPQIAVVGSVNDEAIYETKPGESVADILRAAGGPAQLADTSRVIVYRLDDQNTVGSREIVLGEIASSPATGGDIIQVLSSGSLAHPMERQSVVVRIDGEVNRPGNYFLAPNTPLSQVLEQAGGLTPRAYVYGTKLTRVSVREQQREQYKEAIDQLSTMLASAPLNADQLISPGDREAQIASARQLLDRLRQQEPDGRLVLDLPYGTSALPGDLIVENNDRITIPPRADTVGVFGAVYRPASFLMGARPMKISEYVERSGGAMRSADKGGIFVVRANGDVLTRKKGALGARVQPGDVVFVPVKTQSSSFWARLRDITQIIFQLGLGAATVASIN
jgi:protein involved in polysaccharide export with SLBB domain